MVVPKAVPSLSRGYPKWQSRRLPPHQSPWQSHGYPRGSPKGCPNGNPNGSPKGCAKTVPVAVPMAVQKELSPWLSQNPKTLPPSFQLVEYLLGRTHD